MTEIQIASGETVDYTYNPHADVLDVRLSPTAAPGDFESLSDAPRVRVRRDPASGEVVAIRVHGVQALILEHLVGDIVTLARSALPAPVHDVAALRRDATQAPDRPAVDTDGTPGRSPEHAGDALDAPDAAQDARRRRRRRGRRGRSADGPAEPDATGYDRDRPEQGAVVAVVPDRAVDAAVADVRTHVDGAVLAAVPDQAVNAAVADVRPHVDDAVVPTVPDQSADAPTADVRTHMADAGAADIPHQATAAADRPPVLPPQSAPATAPDGVETPAGFGGLGLDPRLGAAVAVAGYGEPTPIQMRAMPPALAGRDIIGLAQTGTGKTAAFLLPALQHALGTPQPTHQPRILVVTPTRELAVQVGEQAELLARYTSLRVVVVYGGAGMTPQIRALRQGADVVVATPGRLLDHVRQHNVRLDAVEVLVLDESDRMLDMGFLPDVRRIIDLLPGTRQTLLFGATLPPDIESLSRRFQHDPEVVEVARQLPPATLEQTLYPVGRHLKVPLLVHLLRSDRHLTRVLVFTETKVETDIVARKLTEAGLRVAAMHGDRPQKERERALQQLKAGDVQVLVATNVAARGLDIEDVTHVVNYDMPQSVDDYVHRVGRTARGVAEGVACTFVTPGDEGMVLRIQAALGRELPRVTVEGFDYDVPTPSWAQPSARDLARSLHPPSLVNLSRTFVPRRR